MLAKVPWPTPRQLVKFGWSATANSRADVALSETCSVNGAVPKRPGIMAISTAHLTSVDQLEWSLCEMTRTRKPMWRRRKLVSLPSGLHGIQSCLRGHGSMLRNGIPCEPGRGCTMIQAPVQRPGRIPHHSIYILHNVQKRRAGTTCKNRDKAC
ncbi:uncharacterized protein LY79DRAFT_239237 [Colletotrichum navitas]|uniref:Uncharacterized protein n=1 Tax=Colletotrichum navitas TaxID=681940 RepID=A0AAD8V4V1_9PEZI|nr:uncharacterized protein LY79DRAFT_239237 [Colletotrichum navitas]KAK1589729.1 hypothetical protein LY79DRAFT_239237 [Colletotrichum navitas]